MSFSEAVQQTDSTPTIVGGAVAGVIVIAISVTVTLVIKFKSSDPSQKHIK